LRVSAQNNLADPQLEEQLRDQISLRRFVGLGLSEPTPDETSLVVFRRLRETPRRNRPALLTHRDGRPALVTHRDGRPALVTPAKAGVQTHVTGPTLDSRFRGNDGGRPRE